MDIENFVRLRPFVYHLTDRGNLEGILAMESILSTVEIAGLTDVPDPKTLLRTRRPEHVELIGKDGKKFKIRDQRPISIKVLKKCLENNWEPEDFIEHLNNRVFFWPTIKRLETHFGRYYKENPIILRVVTSELIALNPHVEFSRLNSGATRANPYLGGIAPKRGQNTFLKPDRFNGSASKVVEVTFEKLCKLPMHAISIGNTPSGNWREF